MLTLSFFSGDAPSIQIFGASTGVKVKFCSLVWGGLFFMMQELFLTLSAK